MLLRHVRVLNDMGYSVVTFNYSHHPQKMKFDSSFLQALRPRVPVVWQSELTQILDLVEGPKVIFSFSFPSLVVPMALCVRKKNDVKGWICDGGPFLWVTRCTWNFYRWAVPIPNILLRVILTALSVCLWGGVFYKTRLRRTIAQLPEHYPILAFLAEKDLLVPPKAITDVFSRQQSRLNLTFCSLEGVGHLMGLRDANKLYTQSLRDFLQSRSDGIQN